MTMTTINERLEEFIDNAGVAALLEAMEQVMTDKADHIEQNWQDKQTAEVWRRWGRKFGNLSQAAQDYGI
jgi:predicted metalloenzyme YecM